MDNEREVTDKEIDEAYLRIYGYGMDNPELYWHELNKRSPYNVFARGFRAGATAFMAEMKRIKGETVTGKLAAPEDNHG